MLINPQQTIKDLRDTADYMREHPWLQGRNFDDLGGCCAFGAMIKVTGEDRYGIHDWDRTSNACRAFYRAMSIDLTSYNDTEGRTKNQVIRALETVADTLEKDPSRA